MIAGVAGVLATLGAGGCAAPTAVEPGHAPPSVELSGRQLPARPEVLSLAGVNPCDLLSAEQRTDLNVSDGDVDSVSLANMDLQGTACQWSSLADSRTGWIGGVILNRGAADSSSAEPLRVVDGFGAVSSFSPVDDPDDDCQLFVDVGPGQMLSTSFDTDSKKHPGMNHQVACDKAQQLAADMISNLRTKQGR
jgi:Protein of unknown function (DUF3558)